MKALFKKINLFTVLVAIAAASFAFRLSTVVDTPEGKPKNAITEAHAVEESDEEPPPVSDMNADAAQMRDDPMAREENRIQRERGLPLYNAKTYTESELEVLQSLSSRRNALEERERDLARRRALLDAAEKEVDRKIAELNALRGEIERLLDVQTKEQEARLRQLVKIYEAMKPKDAANIFNTLELDVLLQVVGRMSERKSAPVLAEMDPQRARIVTIRLADQKKLPVLPQQ